MKKMTPLDRLFLLAAGLLAAYQIAAGIDGLAALPLVSYTAAFGVLLVAGLLLMIQGFEILNSPLVVVAASLIPLGLSLGLVAEHLPACGTAYLVFAAAGLLAIILARLLAPAKIAALALALVHGVAGLVIFLLPLVLAVGAKAPPGFALVGMGGGLIGVGGLLLAFLKMGRPVLSREAILSLLPGLLLLMTAAFVGGFILA